MISANHLEGDHHSCHKKFIQEAVKPPLIVPADHIATYGGGQRDQHDGDQRNNRAVAERHKKIRLLHRR